MKPLSADEVERYLADAGYVYDHTTGSHAIWKNETKSHAVSVPHHGNKPLGQGILNAIFRECGMKRPER